MKAYSPDLRLKIVQAYQAKAGSQRAVARQFGVSLGFVHTLLRRHRETGSVAAQAHAGGPSPVLDKAALAGVEQHLREQADATLAELCARVHQQCDLTVSVPTMCRTLQRLDWPRKKSHCMPANATRRASRVPATSTART